MPNSTPPKKSPSKKSSPKKPAPPKPAPQTLSRCAWAHREPLISYHDHEWGVPLHNDRRFFEYLILDAAQAGLSWEIVLKKRQGYRRAFANFNPKKVAQFDEAKIQTLLNDPGIIRNRLKVRSAIINAQAFLQIQKEFGSFDAYIWQFVPNRQPIINAWKSLKQLPAKTPQSDAMSRDLRRRGFKFVGSTICYAFMQAAGLINDHTTNCFRYHPLTKPQPSNPNPHKPHKPKSKKTKPHQ